ncbi:MAG: histidine kinase, partial [Gorillibacterium sp.]|nr:histidine kinase [Gorillibacterium sp.]
NNYLKNNLFMKIILLFSLITITIITAFSYLMYRNMTEAVVVKELDYQMQAIESVNTFVGDRYHYVQNIMVQIYRDEGLSSNMSYFLEHSYGEYIQHKLDKFFNGTNLSSGDILQHLGEQVDLDPTVRKLLLYSNEKSSLYDFDHKKLLLLPIPMSAATSYIPEAMSMEDKNLSLPNVWVLKAIHQSNSRLYSFQVPITNMQSLKKVGNLMVYFDAESIWSALSKYKDQLKGSILVLAENGKVAFDSSEELYGKKYPYYDPVSGLYDVELMEKNMYVTMLSQNAAGFTVISVVPKEEIASSYKGIRRTIIAISILCILVAIVVPGLFIMNFAKRTNMIIRFTRRVKSGDLKARITDTGEDELGQISKSFNDMLEELNSYIDMVLKVEIKQKETELTALQARVNPHFLYNTLEVIRMRAISQGALDVGEMIYSLSALFKSYVQQKQVYRLSDELEACQLYLELFRIRYKDMFSYQIHCDKELSSNLAMKMSLQPIIENYIVHGLEQDRDDNLITIIVKREDYGLCIVVKDNGNGFSPERLMQVRESLDLPEAQGGSFGLYSVHQRLKLLHGSRYGIEIDSMNGEGTTVTVRFPELTEEELPYVQSLSGR